MGQTIYVVMSNDSPDSAFSQQPDADAYALKENNLDKQRSPHRKAIWKVYPVEIDVRLGQ